ncbi:hypothetical protein B0I35DRAFT_91551 [Stachybotrys elegans]|uniref:Uncharacterized protein n=1 Tax=Stachybotrys elegans TaxID=80388 RepID=A0A8K0SLM0_9HYPO|nr:hypothetical protein B0I35DRAFT_91551 [Stachybotrys elegans]
MLRSTTLFSNMPCMWILIVESAAGFEDIRTASTGRWRRIRYGLLAGISWIPAGQKLGVTGRTWWNDSKIFFDETIDYFVWGSKGNR